jgi:hypothetical protein
LSVITLVDTNVLIDYLAQHPDPGFTRRVEQVIAQGCRNIDHHPN